MRRLSTIVVGASTALAFGQVTILETDRLIGVQGSITEAELHDSDQASAMPENPLEDGGFEFDLGGWAGCGLDRGLRLSISQDVSAFGDTLSVTSRIRVGIAICDQPSGAYQIESAYGLRFEVVEPSAFVVDLDATIVGQVGNPAFGQIVLIREVGLSSEDIAVVYSTDLPLSAVVSGTLEPGTYQLLADAVAMEQSIEDLPRPFEVPYEESDFWRMSLTVDGLGAALAGFESCPADLAAPFGQLDIVDVVEFLRAFGDGNLSADLAPPFGMFDIADVVEFLRVFGGGCP